MASTGTELFPMTFATLLLYFERIIMSPAMLKM